MSGAFRKHLYHHQTIQRNTEMSFANDARFPLQYSRAFRDRSRLVCSLRRVETESRFACVRGVRITSMILLTASFYAYYTHKFAAPAGELGRGGGGGGGGGGVGANSASDAVKKLGNIQSPMEFGPPTAYGGKPLARHIVCLKATQSCCRDICTKMDSDLHRWCAAAEQPLGPRPHMQLGHHWRPGRQALVWGTSDNCSPTTAGLDTSRKGN